MQVGPQPTTESRLPLFGLSLYYGELEMVSGIRRMRRITTTTTTTTTFALMTVLLIMLANVSDIVKAKSSWGLFEGFKPVRVSIKDIHFLVFLVSHLSNIKF